MPRREKSSPGRSPKPPFEVRSSGIHGRGVFATRRIRKGARIIEYTGQRISSEEAGRRYDDDAMTHHHTFLFDVGPDLLIDAGRHGNEARFINHSCAPNCEAVQEEDRVYIEAKMNIQPGVELSYDYRLTRTGRLPAGWRTLYACRCGAPRCRGTILLVPRSKRARSKKKRRARS